MGLDVHVYRMRKDHVTKDFQVIEDQEIWDDLEYYSEGGEIEKPSIENLFWWGYEGWDIVHWMQSYLPQVKDLNGKYIHVDEKFIKAFKKFVLPSMRKLPADGEEAENFISYAERFLKDKENGYELFICADW